MKRNIRLAAGRPIQWLMTAVLILWVAQAMCFAQTITLAAPQVIHTVAGTPQQYGYSGDGGSALSATFGEVTGIATDSAGNYYVADYEHSVIRAVNTQTSPITVYGVTIAPGDIATVAGTGSSGYSGDGGAATSAQLSYPYNLAIDSSGNMFIADTSNSVIRKVDTSGTITTFAGSSQNGCGYEGGSYGGDGGPATEAQLSCPFGVAVDSTGNVYIADTYNQVIRKVDTGNTITTVAGMYSNNNIYYDCENGGYSGDGGPATSATLDCPTGIAVDAAGNFYIADEISSTIRVVNTGANAVTISGVTIQPGYIETLAGNGQPGYSGDGGTGTAAQLSYPFGVSVDKFGSIFIADEGNNVIRKLDTAGIITTYAGDGSGGYGGDGGPATQAQLEYPLATASDSVGDLYIADLENYIVREVGNGSKPGVDFGQVVVGQNTSMTVTLNINSDVTITNVQTSGDFFAGIVPSNRRTNTKKLSTKTPTMHSIGGPLGKLLAMHPRVTTSRANTPPQPAPCSGTYSQGDSCTVSVQFTPTAPGARWFPLVVTDSNGHNYSFGLTGTGLASASALTPGIISSVAGDGNPGYSGDGGSSVGAELNTPTGITRDSAGNIYIADEGNNVVRKIDTNGNISTYAGNGQAGYSGDNGLATSAQLAAPTDVAIDSAGNLYIADSFNNVIRKVDINGVITTYAGNGQAAFSGDGGAAVYASLNEPVAVAVDKSGDLFISDTSNFVVRKVDANGTITTIAGTNSMGYSGDGGLATSAQLSYPLGVAVDDAGDVYIADSSNYVVRKVGTDGNINTIAGTNQFGYSGDGGPANEAQLSYPYGLNLDAAGNLYIADQYNGVIRLVDGNGNINTIAGTVGVCGNCSRSNSKRTLNGYNQNSSNGDGGTANNAFLGLPVGLVVDAAGNFYIADSYGDAIRKVDVTMSSMTFGNLDPGTSSNVQTATVWNVGSATLNFSQFTIPNGYVQSSVGNDCALLTPLAIGNNCQMAITFSPLLAGVYNGSVSIASDAFQTPQSIAVSGSSGAPAVALQFGLPVPSSVPAGVTVGTVPVDVVDSNGQTVTSSTASVTVTFTGPNSFSATMTAAAVAGVANVDFSSTTLTTPGQYTVTATSNGLTSASANFTVVAADYSISATPTTMTIHQGQSGMATITITPTGGYSGTIQFNCSGMPAYSNCVFSPTSATLDGSGDPVTVQLTVNTTGTNGVISALRMPGSHSNGFPASIFLMPNAMVGILLVGNRKQWSKKSRRVMAMIVLVVVLLGIMALTGCGSSSTPAPTPNHFTPTGSYSATVTATASGGSGSSHTAAVAITIVQ